MMAEKTRRQCCQPYLLAGHLTDTSAKRHKLVLVTHIQIIRKRVAQKLIFRLRLERTELGAIEVY